eukprot:Gregarina_sp_Poly_1__6891@NODE_373_length_9134_cov_257_138745_g301_i1_p1_GENE_NODE_373_length_9134_cov_257_138745_g301_i1NODE_373_length_9134_cov_257_138745_g301_i1_p1_ORF_typecomplete_len709_score53_41ZZ/PF00569_17/1_8e04ZZ/PF00569_17/2_4e07ProkRING_4/PF14447_6/0_15_NODE_373_length_9134_cov_257_138745_g301_i136995825
MKSWVFQINADSRSLAKLRPESQLLTEYVFPTPLRYDDLQEMITHAAVAFGSHGGNGLPRGVLCISGGHNSQAFAALNRDTFAILCTLFGGVPVEVDAHQIPTAFDVSPHSDVIVVPMSLMLESYVPDMHNLAFLSLHHKTHNGKQHLAYPHDFSTILGGGAGGSEAAGGDPALAKLPSSPPSGDFGAHKPQPCQSPSCPRPEDFGVFPCGHALCGLCKQHLCHSPIPTCPACQCPVLYVRPINAKHELGSPQAVGLAENPLAAPEQPTRLPADLYSQTPSSWPSRQRPTPARESPVACKSRRGITTLTLVGEQRCFEARGPRPLLQVLAVLEASNVLTADMLAALLLQFMPTIFQRVQKKVGRINKGSTNFIVSWFSPNSSPEVLVALRQCITIMEQDADLARYATQLKGALSGRPGAPKIGTLLVDCLRTFSDFSFSVQAYILTSLAPDLLPIWRKVLSWCSTTAADEVDHWKVTLDDITHWGYNCAACGLRNVYGPRFRCDSCHNRLYDLCGPCYLTKYKVHDTSHMFRCLFRDVRHGQQHPDFSPSSRRLTDEDSCRNMEDGNYDSFADYGPQSVIQALQHRQPTQTSTLDTAGVFSNSPISNEDKFTTKDTVPEEEEENISSFSRALVEFLSRNVETLKDLLSAPLTEEETMRAQELIGNKVDNEKSRVGTVFHEKKGGSGGTADHHHQSQHETFESLTSRVL